jgi:hypothetical protein
VNAIGVSIIAALSLVCPTYAQLVYGPTPDWVSSDTPVSTGGALVDLDRDGWLDFVVANGNDIYRQKLAVYYNNGDGTLPPTPNWLSQDSEYNGHVSVADVNGDGWMDVAVGLTMQYSGTATARVYLNNGGTLSSLPDWETPDEVAAFHVAFGDVDGDGRPDLAVGTGWPYSGGAPWHNYVYMNVGGVLESTASWLSTDTLDFGDIFFCDANGDGWLDLVGVGEATHTWVYLNDQGVLATTATWHTTDTQDQFSVMGTYGDVNGDGWLDLFTTDNTQLFAMGGYPGNPDLASAGGAASPRGSGNLRRYDGLPGGLFTTTPTWTYFQGYGSAVALVDIDGDGDLDLATGSWWGRTHYFVNDGGLFGAVPNWSSAGTSVVEAICFGDVNNDGLQQTVQSFDVQGPPVQHLFHLPHQPVQQIDQVTVDGLPLGPDEFTADLVHGWVSVGPAPSTSVAVQYTYSVKPDMAVTNWDDVGNYLYYHRVMECPAADPPQPEPVAAAKNRHLSFVPGNAGRQIALRVTLVDLPPPFESREGCKMWVGEPFEVSEQSGDPRGAPAPRFTGANFQATPYCADWGAINLLHLFDDEIVPNALYHVKSIDCECDPSNEADYSPALVITTSKWGDLVGECAVTPCTPPDGTVDFVDIAAIVDKFKNLPAAPIKARTDIAPDLPDRIIDFTDIPSVVEAFRGLPYPYDGPSGCP